MSALTRRTKMCYARTILLVALLQSLVGAAYADVVGPSGLETELRISIRNSASANIYGVVANIVEAPGWVAFESTVDTVADMLLPGQTEDASFTFRIEGAEASACEIAVKVSTTQGIWIKHFDVLAGPSVLPKAPGSTVLFEPEPNPFFASTSIRFNLANEGEVDLTVYDISGRVVSRLASGVRAVGLHVLSWDGQDSDGNKVASGSYFLKLSVGDYGETRKLVLAR